MNKLVILPVIAALFFSSCGKDKDSEDLIKKNLSGFVQKGPFINGSSVTVSELNGDFTQTGKTYNVQITDNKGSFNISDISLTSQYVSLRADGFYFNEITGEQSASQITLYALADVSDQSSVNVNIMSHLEKPRIEYLISLGSTFEEAKVQAQNEVLAIFSIENDNMESAELLDISNPGDGNAILLAVSVILQGYRTEGELTELLSGISSDITEDGTLDSEELGSKLINHAILLDSVSIRENLEDRYADLGADASIPGFGHYLALFLDNCPYEITESPVEYPAEGLYGENILDPDKLEYLDDTFSLAANLCRGATLEIKISLISGGMWYYSGGSEQNWAITSYDQVNHFQYFTSMEAGEGCDLRMFFEKGEYLVEYFEMGRTMPTRSKTITIVNGIVWKK